MSRGALKELIASSLSKFTLMVKDVPHSEKKGIVQVLNHHVTILGDS